MTKVDYITFTAITAIAFCILIFPVDQKKKTNPGTRINEITTGSLVTQITTQTLPVVLTTTKTESVKIEVIKTERKAEFLSDDDVVTSMPDVFLTRQPIDVSVKQEKVKKAFATLMINIAKYELERQKVQKPQTPAKIKKPTSKAPYKRNNRLVVLGFEACPACRLLHKDLESMNTSKYDVVSIDVKTTKDIAVKYSKYSSFPVLLLETPDGKTLTGFVGYARTEREKLSTLLNKYR